MSDHSIVVKSISASAVYAVRHPVLRFGKPFESCVFDGDELDSTTHFGIFVSGQLVGVVSLFLNSSVSFAEKRQFQLRGMAILEQQQGQGFGKLLLNQAESFARGQLADLLWFNARLNAIPFYKSCGYETVGNAFEIGDIGWHYVMFKKLTR